MLSRYFLASLWIFIITAIVVIALVILKKKYRAGFYSFFIGIFIAVFTGIWPIMATLPDHERILHGMGLVSQVYVTALQTIQVFTANVGVDFLFEYLYEKNVIYGYLFAKSTYFEFMSFLFMLAPLLTFGFILSFFKGLWNICRYYRHCFSDMAVFSELNEKSLAVAKSIHMSNAKTFIIFANVKDSEGEFAEGLLKAANELGALLWENNLMSINFHLHSKKSTIMFYLMSDAENENELLALKVKDKYAKRDRTELYVFSSGTLGGMLFGYVDKSKDDRIKVRRIDMVREIVYSYLYNSGNEIFEAAENSGQKDDKGRYIIKAVILGCGKYGNEFFKALVWLCQMDEYALELHIFDADANLESKMKIMYPELFSSERNGKYVDGECYHNIKLYPNMNVSSEEFIVEYGKIDNPTIVFVCLGDDVTDIEQAENVRMLSQRNMMRKYSIKEQLSYFESEKAKKDAIENAEKKENPDEKAEALAKASAQNVLATDEPIIKAVVYNSDLMRAMKDLSNNRGQAYNIGIIGDLETAFSENEEDDGILSNILEDIVKDRHKKYREIAENGNVKKDAKDNSAAYWNNEYNYRSTLASVVHSRIFEKIHKEKWDKEQRKNLEHRRWNAYVRSEGYIAPVSDNTEIQISEYNTYRDGLGKIHPDLIPYDELPPEEKEKDDNNETGRKSESDASKNNYFVYLRGLWERLWK